MIPQDHRDPSCPVGIAPGMGAAPRWRDAGAGHAALSTPGAVRRSDEYGDQRVNTE